MTASKQPTDLAIEQARDIIYKHLEDRYILEDGEDAYRIAVKVIDNLDSYITSQVNQRVKAALPERKPRLTGIASMDESTSKEDIWREHQAKGWNDCRADIEANLKGGSDGAD